MTHSLLTDLPAVSETGTLPSAETPLRKRRKWLNEPFLHFLVLGGILFLVSQYVQQVRNRERYEIKLGKEQLARLASLWEKQYGASPDEKQLQALADNFIREEILYREGLDLGLDKNDEVIRRRVVQKQEFLQEDLAIVQHPDEATLQHYYSQQKDKYFSPAKVSFTHIYFSPDLAGEKDLLLRAKTVLAQVKAEGRARAPELGDRFPYLYDYAEQSESNVVHQLGESELSKNILSLPVGQWSGPLRSGYGYHLVHVTGKTSLAAPPYAEIKEKLLADYLQDTREEKNKEALSQLAKQYTILKE